MTKSVARENGEKSEPLALPQLESLSLSDRRRHRLGLAPRHQQTGLRTQALRESYGVPRHLYTAAGSDVTSARSVCRAIGRVLLLERVSSCDRRAQGESVGTLSALGAGGGSYSMETS